MAEPAIQLSIPGAVVSSINFFAKVSVKYRASTAAPKSVNKLHLQLLHIFVTMSDSSFSYIHMRRSHHVLHMEQWYRDELPNDMIESLTVDNDADSHAVANQAFGTVKNKTKRDAVWKDTHPEKFLSDDAQWWKDVEDNTILSRLERHAPQQQIHHYHQQNLAGDPEVDAFEEATKSPIQEATTPEMMRNRPQKNVQSFQTPIGRILR